MKLQKRAVHLDFHTMPKVYDVGAQFDAAEFAATLVAAQVDFVTVFARCNLGFTYYPTEVGIKHPSLQGDLLGPMVAACHERGIQVAAYINAGLDHEHALRHRDWCVVNRRGQVCTEDKLNHFCRMMCFNSGYGDYIADMIAEIRELYPVDGFFLDCIGQPPCYGVECLEAMAEQGMDILDDEAVAAFAHQTKLRFAERARELVGDDKMLFFNGIPYKDQIRYASHIEIECLPTGGWGYDTFPSTVRYTRNLGLHVVGQTGRFHGGWGDHGGLRPRAALEFDCFHAISHGVACGVGDHMHPRGRLAKDVYDMIGSVYADVAALDPWTDNASTWTDMAIVAPPDYRPSPDAEKGDAITGATRLLAELNYQFDIVDEDMELLAYRVLVLPDETRITEVLQAKLADHLARDGIIVSSAYAGLNPVRSAFALDAWGLDFIGPEEYNVTFFTASAPVARDLPAMPTTIYETGIAMTARDGAEVLAELHKPYFNRHWDGFHGNVYIPPDKTLERPAAARSGNVLHFSFPIFASYHRHAAVAYRTLVRNCLEHMRYEPLLRVQGLPSFGRATLTRQPGRFMAHLLAYCPELRGQLQIIEEPVSVNDVSLSIRAPGGVRAAMLAPSEEKLAVSRDSDRVSLRIPHVRGYQMIVFEE